jgi:hypothetical protein
LYQIEHHQARADVIIGGRFVGTRILERGGVGLEVLERLERMVVPRRRVHEIAVFEQEIERHHGLDTTGNGEGHDRDHVLRVRIRAARQLHPAGERCLGDDPPRPDPLEPFRAGDSRLRPAHR